MTFGTSVYIVYMSAVTFWRLKNRFAALEVLDTEVDINSALEMIRENRKKSAKDSLSYYELKNCKPWFDEWISKLLDVWCQSHKCLCHRNVCVGPAKGRQSHMNIYVTGMSVLALQRGVHTWMSLSQECFCWPCKWGFTHECLCHRNVLLALKRGSCSESMACWLD
jgi:hypothetical protein